jgi:hypothetical protein
LSDRLPRLALASSDIGGREVRTGLVYLTIGWFLRHNLLSCQSSSRSLDVRVREIPDRLVNEINSINSLWDDVRSKSNSAEWVCEVGQRMGDSGQEVYF